MRINPLYLYSQDNYRQLSPSPEQSLAMTDLEDGREVMNFTH